LATGVNQELLRRLEQATSGMIGILNPMSDDVEEPTTSKVVCDDLEGEALEID